MKEINIRESGDNIVKLLADDWGLLAAGDEAGNNGMTVSWGGLGEIWGRDAVFVFARPQRYTREFLERHDTFSLSFFGGEYKKELALFGGKSGRDMDKFAATGLTRAFECGCVYPEQAELVVICRKIAFFDLGPEGYLDETIMQNYPISDFHRMYVGEIVKTLAK